MMILSLFKLRLPSTEQQTLDIIITYLVEQEGAQRDVTIPAISSLLKRLIPGFGEAFRHISFVEIGTRALASQALAGYISAISSPIVYQAPRMPVKLL